jgi:hypothetical protein
MSAHVFDELPRLLTGEADRDTVMDAAAHLRECADCRQELVSALVAHAALTSAQRFAPEVAGGGEEREPVAGETAFAMPDLSAVFAQARDDAATAAQQAARSRRRNRILTAAAAVVVVAGGITGGLLATASSSGPAQRTVTLVGAAHVSATATLIGGDHMRIDATALPALGPHRQYEVWLTNSAGTAMQSVGFMRSDRRADISVPAPLMGHYQDIAVSVQRDSQTQFSGKVVLHGSYE